MRRLLISIATAAMFSLVAGAQESTYASLEALQRPALQLSPDIKPEKVMIIHGINADMSDARTIGADEIIYGQNVTLAKDYSLSITIPGCADNNELPLTITVGSDIKAVKYLCYEGNYSASAFNMQFVADYGDEVDSDDYASMTIKLTTERNSRHTLFVVGLDSSGNYRAGVSTYFYSINDNDDQWTTIGTSMFVDDMLASIYSSIYTATSTVTIQENKKTPGYYRLVSPYGRSYSYYYKNKYSHTHKHYIYIHAEDPNKVYIEESPICMDLGHGGISVASLAIPDWTDEDPTPYYGTFANHRITFPQKALVVSMQNYNNGTWYRANSTGRTSIPIPYSAAPQTITWDQTFGTYYIDDVITLNATASSGLPVTYTLSDDSLDKARIEGNILTFTGGGIITVTASQPGDGNEWEPAASVTKQIGCSTYHLTDLFVCGSFNDWAVEDDYMLTSEDGSMYSVTLPGNIFTNNGEPVQWHIQTPDGAIHFGLGDEVGEGGTRIICGGDPNITNLSGKPTVILFVDDDIWVEGAYADMTIIITESVEGIIPDTLYVMGEIEDGAWSPDAMAQLTKEGNIFTGTVNFTGSTFILCEHPATETGDWLTLGTFFGPAANATDIYANAPLSFVAGNSELPFFIKGDDVEFPLTADITADFNTMQLSISPREREKTPQTIVWEQPFGKIFVGDEIELTAEATSDLDVVYQLADGSEAYASIDGNLLTITGVGTITIIATQPGNGAWAAAEGVEKQLEVDPFDFPDTLCLVGDFEGHDWDVDNVIEMTRSRHTFSAVVVLTGDAFFLCEHAATTPGDWGTVGRTFCADDSPELLMFGTSVTIVPDSFDYLFTLDDEDVVYPIKSVVTADFDKMNLSLMKYSELTDISDEAIAQPLGEPVYYNLQGVRINPDNAAPGIYIRVVPGGRTSKILIR